MVNIVKTIAGAELWCLSAKPGAMEVFYVNARITQAEASAFAGQTNKKRAEIRIEGRITATVERTVSVLGGSTTQLRIHCLF
ncbi:MAG: hypothetical protein LiPW15_479 [Parcubacteria group bacterium LiPW_15]|nr:MAG: hypothetical protein LiPW15_479 [Parcubacteria group bacterium LiPW_15]